MPAITTGTLRDWLAGHIPVTVLDVRAPEDREQWSIPGCLHVNAYEALKQGRPDALAGLDLPTGPVVTVCNRGIVSQIAAEQLRAQGFDAMSLEGGMHAWSLAWNVAEVPLPITGTRLLQVRRTGKGCLSYILGGSDEAAVIDAALDPSIYIRLAEDHGWRIRYVFDTHIHADHFSRSKLLAEATGATLLMPVSPFPLTAISTPGHTAESTCYLLDDACLFTGDTLFLTAVGRPDLHANQEEAQQRARSLFQSLTRLRALPPHLLVLPGHTGKPVPFDGIPLTASLQEVFSNLNDWFPSPETSTAADSRGTRHPSFQFTSAAGCPAASGSEDAFVTRVLSRLPPSPPNYQKIVELNRRGTAAGVDLTELEAGANRCAVA